MAAGTQVRKKDIVPIKLILIFAILSAGIIAASFITYSGYKKHYRTEVENELTAIADLQLIQVVHWLNDCKRDAEVIFNNASFSNLARHYLKNPKDSETDRQLRGWLEEYLKGYDYDQIRLLDTHGVTRMSVPAGRPPASTAVTNRIEEVLQSGRITIVDLYRHAHDRRIYLSILIPILDSSTGKRVVGVLSLRFDPENYLYPFILSWPTPSETAETLLVRRDGNDVLFLVDPRFRKDAALKFRIPLNRTESPDVRAVLGRVGTVEGVDYRGQPVIAYILPVPDTLWFLEAHKDTSEVYGQARVRLWMVVGFVTALLFGSGAGLALVWRQQTIAFYKERKKADDVIYQNEERLRVALSTVDMAVFNQDMDLRYTWMYSLQLGYIKDQAIGKRDSELLPPDFAQQVTELKRQVLESGEGRRCEVEGTVDNKRIYYDLIVEPLRNTSGKIIGITGASLDITELKQAQYKIASLAAIVDSSTDAIISATLEGIIVSWNPGAETLYGYSDKEAIGRSLSLLIPPDRPDEITTIFEKIRSGETVAAFDTLRVRKDGTLVDVSLTVSPIKDSQGEVIGVSGIARDITDRKKLEEKIKQHSKELEQSNRELDNFALIAAHDLNAPLRAVSGFTNLLQKHYKENLDADADRYISYIVEGTGRMQHLISDLLQYARTGTRGKPLVPVNVNAAIEKTLANLTFEIQESGAVITVNPLPTVYADSAQLMQLFQNLVGNAIKYSSNTPHIHISAEREDGEWLFRISDNGIGIDPQHFDRIFQIFQRLHTRNEYSGTGIGLAICKKIVERLGGRIWVESEPGEGSTFFFTLLVSES